MSPQRLDADRELAVEASGVAYSYGARRALDGLSFSVERGEIFGFLGPNGGGKTTLFRLLATLAVPQEGRVEILGHDLTRRPAAVRRELGVAFQSPSLDLQLTVVENLRHQGRLYGLHGRALAARIDAQLTRFGLGERRGERAAVLSGGLRRRVELAKALLHRPPLLLLDEPSTGLDPGARRELWRTLSELSDEEGVTVLLTTHFMEEGDRCDRLALIDRGRAVAMGTPAALEAEIGGDVVEVECADPASLAAEIARSFEVEAVAGEDRVRFEHPAAHELVARIAERFPGRIAAIRVAAPTLEDVFLRHTGRRLWQEES